MVRQRLFVVLSILLLPRWSLEQAAESCGLETSLQPRGIENSTLEVPLGGSRQINFTVSFVNEGINYRPALFVDGTYLIDNNNFVNDGYLQIVRRGCNNSDRPGVTCRLLQLTVNGRVGFRDLNGSSLQFAVRGSDVLDISCSTSTITIKIIEQAATTENVSPTTESPTTQQPTTMATTTPQDVVSVEARKSECRQILTTEIVVPWIFVGLLGALELVTAALLITVLCKYRRRDTEKSVDSAIHSATTDSKHSSVKGSDLSLSEPAAITSPSTLRNTVTPSESPV